MDRNHAVLHTTLVYVEVSNCNVERVEQDVLLTIVLQGLMTRLQMRSLAYVLINCRVLRGEYTFGDVVVGFDCVARSLSFF